MCADYTIADSLKIPISSNNTGYAKEILVGLTSGGGVFNFAQNLLSDVTQSFFAWIFAKPWSIK